MTLIKFAKRAVTGVAITSVVLAGVLLRSLRGRAQDGDDDWRRIEKRLRHRARSAQFGGKDGPSN